MASRGWATNARNFDAGRFCGPAFAVSIMGRFVDDQGDLGPLHTHSRADSGACGCVALRAIASWAIGGYDEDIYGSGAVVADLMTRMEKNVP